MEKKRFLWPVTPVAEKENTVSGINWRFTVLTDCLVRMEYDPSGRFEDRASQTVFHRDFKPVEYQVNEDGCNIIIETSKLSLRYQRGEDFSAETLSVRLKYEPASVWNFGDDFEDLGGTTKTLDTIAGEIPVGRGVCSRFGFSVLDDSKSMLLNEDGWVECRSENTRDVYFFGYGYDYLASVRDFYRLTGVPPMLPAYALGNWWSRYYKYTQQEYTDLMKRFSDEDIPFTVSVIDMDWHLVSEVPQELKPAYSNYAAGWTGYTWNKKLFPDYREFLKYLQKTGHKVSLNLHPADGVRRHEDMYEEMAKACGIDPDTGERVPFDILSENFMEKYFDILHHPYEDEGVDFWWMDWQQGTDYRWIHEPNSDGNLADPREVLDPLWMLNHLHIIDNARSGKRPMFFSRYSGPGSHRYPVGFSGDTVTCWDSLDFQPCFTSTSSNIGYSWWSHDIGGHMGGYRDDELTVRWMQLGVFSPINRLHSTSNDFQRKEPWSYGKASEAVMKDWLRLRHRMFPYIYTMNYRNHNDLIPTVLPMYYTHPKTSAAYEAKNQYWFGSELIVAPITEPNGKITLLGKADAWLPKGDWFDFFTGLHYHSGNGRKIKLFRTLETYPVLAKAGGIVPMAVYEPHENRLFNSENMQVVVFPGADNTFTLYEDEGEYNRFENGAFAKTEMSLKWGKSACFTIGPAKGDLSLIPAVRNWSIRLRGFHRTVSVCVTVDSEQTDFTARYSKDSNTTEICFSAPVTALCRIEIAGEKLVHDNADYLDRCENVLQHSQTRIETKTQMLRIITDEKYDIHQKLWRISEFSPDEQDLTDALKELLTLRQGEFEGDFRQN